MKSLAREVFHYFTGLLYRAALSAFVRRMGRGIKGEVLLRFPLCALRLISAFQLSEFQHLFSPPVSRCHTPSDIMQL